MNIELPVCCWEMFAVGPAQSARLRRAAAPRFVAYKIAATAAAAVAKKKETGKRVTKCTASNINKNKTHRSNASGSELKRASAPKNEAHTCPLKKKHSQQKDGKLKQLHANAAK